MVGTGTYRYLPTVHVVCLGSVSVMTNVPYHTGCWYGGTVWYRYWYRYLVGSYFVSTSTYIFSILRSGRMLEPEWEPEEFFQDAPYLEVGCADCPPPPFHLPPPPRPPHLLGEEQQGACPLVSPLDTCDNILIVDSQVPLYIYLRNTFYCYKCTVLKGTVS